MTRDQALARLRAQVAAGTPIIGAGAGTGLSAKCAEAGGGDLIIIYNSGRYRMAGRGSLAGLMPYGDANAIVMEMAAEVLPVLVESLGLLVTGTGEGEHPPSLPARHLGDDVGSGAEPVKAKPLGIATFAQSAKPNQART